VDVAWATHDLFDEATLRPFVGHLRSAPRLAWLQWTGAGTEHPMLTDLHRRGVRITTTHASSGPIAEFVMRSVLDCLQEAQRWRTAAEAHDWRRHDFREVTGSQWLIIGAGHIGSAVAQRAAAFDAHVVAVRRSGGHVPGADEVVGPDAVADRLRRADVVVLTAPSTPTTRGMVDEAFLAAMRPGSVLVNVARGDLIDERALLAALGRGAPSWAVLDTFATEPLPGDSPLWSHPAVVVTPHAAGMGERRHERAAAAFVGNFRRFSSGAPLVDEVLDPAAAVYAMAGEATHDA
jgi:phosphoglycerate dehydrogenase-like enzyme